MTGSKQSGRSVQWTDDDLQPDDGGFRWGDGDHRFAFGGHEDLCVIHKDLVLSVAPTATSGDFDMHAILDSPGPTQGRPLMILVSGFSYDHQYWDPPVGDGKYSFVEAANKAGYATLNLDRLGLGTSDKPPADLTTIQDQADELHQIIQSIKSGALSNYGFSKIVLVGHSLGSAIVQTEAGAYQDADGLVLTGFRHEVNPAGAGEFINSIHPAAGEPSGYLTMDNRSFLFDTGHTSKGVLAWDASHIGTGTAAELNFPASVKYETVAGTADGDADFVAQTDTVFFAPTQAQQTSGANWIRHDS